MGQSIRFFEQAPCPALRPFIRRFLLIEFPREHRDAHLPDISPVAAFSLRGSCRVDGDGPVPHAAFTGVYEKLRTHEHCDAHGVLLAAFQPGGAAAFVREPLDRFSGATNHLSDALRSPAEIDRLHDRIAGAENHGSRIAFLEDFLLMRLGHSEPDPLVAAAVRWIEQGNGGRRIEQLSRYIGLSQSALERRFRRIVGVTPKRFASVVRLRHAAELCRANVDLTTAAHAAGYFDQSHFINHFRRATGRSPQAFFRRNQSPGTRAIDAEFFQFSALAPRLP